MLQEICCCTPVTFKLTFATAAEMMHDDEDWDPTRVRAAKRRAIQRKADRKRRKTRHRARDTDEAKRAEASRQERLSRQENPQ